MKQPVDHIERPRLPWRTADDQVATECGYDASKVSTLSRDEHFARVKEMGEQRASLFTCMTCAQTARRHRTWDEDPRQAIGREVEWETGWRKQKNGQRLRDELLAIKALIELHPGDFETLLKQQQWRAKKPKATPDARRHVTHD